jgi:dienelactone hydrolase
MKRRFVLTMVMAAWTVSLAAAPAELNPLTTEEIRFESPESIALSADRSKYELAGPIALSGQLALPSGKGPFALVVLAHGCDGISPVETGWANLLGEWGYATLLLDSFTERGIEEVCTNAPALRPIQRVPDVYGALRTLGKHSRVDSRRVVLMGFSHGGAVALTAATAWAKAHFAPPERPAFRAFVSFYPSNCNVEYPERKSLSAPVRVHIGELDDWTPAAPCIRLVNEWKVSRQDVAISTYPGAHHAFDYPDLPHTRLADVDNGAGCTIRIAGPFGPLVPPVEGVKCVKKGSTVAGNRGATGRAEQLVRQQLSELLK